MAGEPYGTPFFIPNGLDTPVNPFHLKPTLESSYTSDVPPLLEPRYPSWHLGHAPLSSHAIGGYPKRVVGIGQERAPQEMAAEPVKELIDITTKPIRKSIPPGNTPGIGRRPTSHEAVFTRPGAATHQDDGLLVGGRALRDEIVALRVEL
ncbi:unnamed protein product [Tuber melanosporum]|uniref:(Perigord truffle) hypothetical protein n=1 Tax=Tuber melanosporum (strain Mel28) TaxID=656061 RepID=D5GD66_TUBMM|nr:uncharacterized protein GSTUM_00006063001 [Tuber melanosporum]CAZ82459.1 unnamed protein product [Tuber melanosporum]